MSTLDITNNNIGVFKNILKTYHNSFIMQQSTLPTAIPPSIPYFFNEMTSIDNSIKLTQVPSESTTTYPLNNFNDFIRGCINFKISNRPTSYDPLFKILENNTSDVNQKADVIGNIHRHINLLNVIIDIFEAYKVFIDENSQDLKEKVNKITTIEIVNKHSRLTEKTGIKNYGYLLNESTLILSINSFNISTTPPSINSVLTVTGNDINTIAEFNTNTTSVSPATPANTYKKQSVTKSSAVYNKTDENKDTIGKKIIENVLYYLINMDKDHCRNQVYSLYHYYKFVKCQVLLTCATINLAINNLKQQPKAQIPHINLMKQILTSQQYRVYESNDDFSTVQTKSIDNSIDFYDKIVLYVDNEIKSLLNSLYLITNIEKKNFNSVNDISFDVNLSNINNTKNATTINLDYSTSALVSQLNAINVSSLKDEFKNEMVFVYGGTQYIIDDISTTNITIKAIFTNKDTYDDAGDVLPIFPVEFTNSDQSLKNCKLIKKSLITLKNEYIAGKKDLSGINSSIMFNSMKINNQKTNFNSNKSKDDLLNNQILSYNIILGLVLAVFVAIHVIGLEKALKKTISFVIAGIVTLLIIVYYILNGSYLQEDFTNKGFGTVEKFSTSIINKTSDLKTAIGASYERDKMKYLQNKLDNFSIVSLEYFQKVSSIIPLTETQDFYVELNRIIEFEKSDKTNINDILTYKKTLGYSNVDLLKYEINNKKVYIVSILAISFIYSLLYLLSQFIPDEYLNLIIFTGLIFGIIVFSYYIIFTNKLVKTKSNHKYWGPETVK